MEHQMGKELEISTGILNGKDKSAIQVVEKHKGIPTRDPDKSLSVQTHVNPFKSSEE